MRFSIVIPTWEQYGKGVFFLNQLLNSIKKQTFTDFEVVISDHSINDEIENLCFNFEGLDFLYIRNPFNRGNSPANLNTGLKHAKGEIIKIMFQDDLFIEDYSLYLIDKCFKETPYKWLVNGSCITKDSVNFTNHMVPRWNDEILKGVNTISSPSVLSFVNKNILFFDENLVMLMDCDYYYSLYKKYGIPCIVTNCLVANTLHEHQISGMYDKDLQLEIDALKNKYMNLENDGERMDIDYYNMNYDNFDVYQKSHYRRYEMARTLVQENFIVGDMACGSGYGSLMLSERCKEVHGVDIDTRTISEINKRYKDESKVTFYNKNLLDIDFENKFDLIVSFETVEHFEEHEITKLLSNFHKALKPNGSLVFSTPYNQEQIPASMKWHKTFYITENKVDELIKNYFKVEETWYQDYNSHTLNQEGLTKDFIICKAKKI